MKEITEEKCFLKSGSNRTLSLDALLFHLAYPEATEKTVRKKLNTPGIEEIAVNAYSGEDFNFELCKRMPITRLAVVTYLLLQKYGEYKGTGASDEIIFDTFRDVTLRSELYREKTGKVGISKEDVIWFRHIMNIKIFKIGALQYQPFEMIYLDEETIGEPYMVFSEEQKAILPNGAPVINCHIQKRANLSPSAVEKSLEEAQNFFYTAYSETQFRAFICYSWLLYPPMVEELSVTSNIRRFAERFSVIGSCNDEEQALENLFGWCKQTEGGKATTLQKLAKEQKQFLGFACGIIPIVASRTKA